MGWISWSSKNWTLIWILEISKFSRLSNLFEILMICIKSSMQWSFCKGLCWIELTSILRKAFRKLFRALSILRRLRSTRKRHQIVLLKLCLCSLSVLPFSAWYWPLSGRKSEAWNSFFLIFFWYLLIFWVFLCLIHNQ